MSKLIEQVKRHEDAQHVGGTRFKMFKDTTGNTTIGWGRNLDTNGISESEAEALLTNDIQTAREILLQNFPMFISLDEVRLGVLTELTFNMGITGLKTFKQMLKAMKDGNFKLAAIQLLNSDYAIEVGNRAKELASELQNGVWV